MKKILYFIQLPPPIHGVSTINKIVYESTVINNNVEKHLLEIKFSKNISDLRKFNVAKFFTFISLFFKLLAVLIKIKPNYIYFSLMPVGKGFFRDFLFVLLMKMFSCKLIFHIHNAGIKKNSEKKCWRFFYRITFKNTNVIVLSEKLKEIEYSKLELKNTHFFVVNNGVEKINLSEFDEDVSDKINILFLSNLFAPKGAYTILEIFKDISEKFQNIHLNIIGDNYKNENQRLSNFIENHNLSNRVSLFEKIYEDNRHSFFMNSHIFVFPSKLKCESFPLVLLEAMQFKLPVVSYDIGATSEIVDNNQTGFVVPLGDKEAFKQRVEELIKIPEMRIQFGENAYKKFKDKYTSEVFENRMYEVFSKTGLYSE